MTVLESFVREFQNILTPQFAFVKDEIKGTEDILPMKETLLGTLQIHLLDAEAQLKGVWRLRDMLTNPHELTKVESDPLTQLSLAFSALGTYMGTLTEKKSERLQESLTTTNIVQKKTSSK